VKFLRNASPKKTLGMVCCRGELGDGVRGEKNGGVKGSRCGGWGSLFKKRWEDARLLAQKGGNERGEGVFLSRWDRTGLDGAHHLLKVPLERYRNRGGGRSSLEEPCRGSFESRIVNVRGVREG